MASDASLSEFKRSASLDVDRRAVARIDLFVDTGGYSRVNLYRITDTSLLLRDAYESYVVGLDAGVITTAAVRRSVGTFVGSFDVDAAGDWRFLPATERRELPTELSGG